jgi:GxxExxY protein
MIKENELTKEIVDCCIKIHRELGPGLLESVYEEVLAYELHKRNVPFERQVTIPVTYDSLRLDLGFRADIIVEDTIMMDRQKVRCF